MPPSSSKAEPAVAALYRELEALRARLDQAPEWFKRPQDTMRAGALAEEVKRMCQEASRSDDDDSISALLETARARLDELQALLGPQ